MSELKNWENYSSVSEGENYQVMAQLDVSDDVSVYNEKEIEYLDRYLPMIKNAFDETELYEIIIDCNFNDEKIKEIITERLKYLNAKGDQYGWKVVGKQKPKATETTENVKKGNNNKQGNRKNKGTRNRKQENIDDENTQEDNYQEYENQDYFNQYDSSNYYGKKQYYRNNRNRFEETNENTFFEQKDNTYNYYNNNRRTYYGKEKGYGYNSQYYYNYNNNYEVQGNYNYSRRNDYYNQNYDYNNNYNNYNNYYNNNNYYKNYNNGKYVPKYKVKRRNYNNKAVDYIDVTDQKLNENRLNDFVENTQTDIQNNQEETITKTVENQIQNNVVDHSNNEDNIKEEKQISSSIKVNTTNITNTLFETNENERRVENKPLFEERKDNKIEEIKPDESEVDLKHYFAILRTGATGNENINNENVMNNQYYNNNLDLQKKYENVNNAANNTSSSSKQKQVNSNNSLHLNTQFFEINNSKTNSKTQFLDHTRIDNNSQINRLSFTINSSIEKEVENPKKNNAFVIESNSVLMNSNKPVQLKQESQLNKDLVQNEYLREQFQNYNNNKFNKNSPPMSNYPSMYNNTPYFFNQEAMNKNPGFEDPQTMMNNTFFPQTPFYAMPFNYYGFPYERSMFNMVPNTMDPTIMNMYFQFQQQPNFYNNMANDPSMNSFQYTNNVNYKKNNI